jgi:hypothetical protein
MRYECFPSFEVEDPDEVGGGDQGLDVAFVSFGMTTFEFLAKMQRSRQGRKPTFAFIAALGVFARNSEIPLFE